MVHASLAAGANDDVSIPLITGWGLAGVALATSIDAAAAGVTIAFLQQPVLVTCAIIGIVTSRCMATSPARAANSVRMRWLSRLLTCTWRYQPVRTIWASPSASLASVLLSRNDKAALTWRASRQITGRP